MRTLHVDTGPSWRGGQRQVLLLARGLERQGVQARLVCPPASPLAQRAAAAGIGVHPMPLRGSWDLSAAWRIRRLVRQWAPHVLHAHTAHAVTLVGLATAGLSLRPLRIAARRVDFPLSRLGTLQLRRVADAVLCVSSGVAGVVREAGLAGDRVRVVHSGIDVEEALAGADPEAARRSLGLAASHRVVGNIAALVGHKDHASLVEAARRVCSLKHGVRFVILGAGPLEQDLRGQIAAAGLADRVLLPGFRQDIPSWLALFDLFALSSSLEGLGTTLLDAMAARRPIVATRTGGVPEMIEHEVTGLLVPPRDPPALAAAITRLLDDDALAARLARAAGRRVRESFSAERMVEETISVYRELSSISARQRG